jgi:hypothetical protein
MDGDETGDQIVLGLRQIPPASRQAGKISRAWSRLGGRWQRQKKISSRFFNFSQSPLLEYLREDTALGIGSEPIDSTDTALTAARPGKA